MRQLLTRTLPSLLLVPTLASVGLSQTVTVTTIEDVVDVAGSAMLDDLPGPDGRVSFREALIATNNTSGPQTVAFAIPQDDWWLFDDYAALKLELGAFVVIDDGTTLDFSTQTAFTGDTNPFGTEVGIFGLQANGWGTPAIFIAASDCVVRGLGQVSQRGAAVSIASGARNRIVGCVTSSIELDPQPGVTTDNVIGGTAADDGNRLVAVEILCGASDNVVIGNELESVSVVGSQYCTIQHPERNRIGGSTAAERNVIAGAGYRSSEGFPTGFNVQVLWAKDTLVEGNYIGVDRTGTQRVPQIAPTGVHVADSLDTTVRDNLIAGMHVFGSNHYAGQVFGRGIWIGAINADNVGVVVEGNRVGIGADGRPILTLNGIRVDHSTGSRNVRNVRIGDGTRARANEVAYTEQTGVAISGAGVQAELSGNSVHDNGALAIDLGSFFQGEDGVTLNDAGDADSGGNELQNYPELTKVVTAGGALAVRGSLSSRPLREYRIEFFANELCDPSGHGECERYLGACRLTTDASGNAAFLTTLAVQVPAGYALSATATDLAAGTTSECAPCALVQRGRAFEPAIPR